MKIRGTIIGINQFQYPEIRELTSAVRDAQAIYSLFHDNFPSVQLDLLINEQATTEQILGSLSSLERVDPEDFVVVYFSGHGSEDYYLVPHDLNPDQINKTIIRMDTITDLFVKIPSKNVIVILDCCFSGNVGAKLFVYDKLREKDLILHKENLLDKVLGEGRVIITASQNDQPAYEHPKFRHGLLTHFLIQGLTGQLGDTTQQTFSILDLSSVVIRYVEQEAEKWGIIQTPTFKGSISGDFRFPTLTRGASYSQFFPEWSPIVIHQLQDLKAIDFPDPVIEILATHIPNLNDLQLQSINEYGLFQGNNLIVSAPTSSGKTMVGELAALRSFVENKKCMFLVPLKAIVNDKYQEFQTKYGEYGIRIIRSCGNVSDNDFELVRNKYDICFMTYEKFTSMVLSNPHVLDAIGLVVIDELQMLVNQTRGMNVEFLLTLLRMSSDRGVSPQIIGLSAVIGDMNHLHEWLNAQLLISNKRPIPLQEGVLGNDGVFTYSLDGEVRSEVLLKPGTITPIKNSAQDLVIPLVRSLVQKGEKVIVFRNFRGSTRGCAQYLAQALRLTAAEKVLEVLPQHDLSLSSTQLRNCLNHGIAFHNSDLERVEREAIENDFRDLHGQIKVIVATSTLAMGVNTPASSVIIVELENVDGSYTVAEYKNMVGRAGRLGFSETGKSFIIAQNPAEHFKAMRDYVQNNPEPIVSQLDRTDLPSLIVRVISVFKEVTESTLLDYFANSYGGYLLSFSSRNWKEQYAQRVQQVLSELLQTKLLEKDNDVYYLTDIGRICGEDGLQVRSMMKLLQLLRVIPAEQFNIAAFLTVIQATDEMEDMYFAFHKKSNQEKERWPATLIREFRLTPSLLTEMKRLSRHDDVEFSLKCKKACSLLYWIHGKPIDWIEQTLQQHNRNKEISGDVRNLADRAKTFVTSLRRIILALYPEQLQVSTMTDNLVLQLEWGIPEALLIYTRCNVELTRGELLSLHNAIGREQQVLNDQILYQLLGEAKAKQIIEGLSKVS